MVWPGVSDYQEAMQVPRLCFGDPELKNGTPVLTSLGLPRPISGGSASVYQLSCGKLEFAVRCFLRDIPDLQQRYAAIGRHLAACRLASTVGFDYLPQGIRVQGRWYPVLKMAWVRGVPLNDRVAAILKNRSALAQLADDWAALAQELEQARIVHGDLQHGNVLVADRGLVLIDYDGMYVPALGGSPSHELGHPAYQHPRRQPADCGPGIDRFSALAVHVALSALQRAPELWQRHDNTDNLLFTREDFEDPDASALFAAIERLGDAGLTASLQRLRSACKGPIDKVPALAGGKPAAKVRGAKAAPAPPRPRARPPQLAAAAPRAAGGPSWLPGKTAQPEAPERSPEATPETGGAGATLALEPLWQRNVQAEVTLTTAAGVSFDRTQRAVVWLLLLGLLLLVAHAHSPDLLWPVMGVWVLLTAVVRRWARRRRLAAGRQPIPGRRLPSICALALSPDGKSVATVGDGRVAVVLDVASGKVLQRLGPHGSRLTCIAAANRKFATGTWDGRFAVFDAGGATVRAFRDRRCHAAASSRDGGLLAFGLRGGPIRLRSADGERRGKLRGHKRQVQALAFAPGARRLLSAGADRTVRVWSLEQRRCLHLLRCHQHPVTALAISPDGAVAASGDRSGRICLWDLAAGRLAQAVETRTRGVHALAFVGDGHWLLAGLADHSLLGVDVASGHPIGRLGSHDAPVTALAAGPDGERVVSADAAGNLALWSCQSRTVTRRRRKRAATTAPS